tara:strand:+ start:138 stop:284 length:147 start_codon:yes stop_codon:yes gene_type:complete
LALSFFGGTVVDGTTAAAAAAAAARSRPTSSRAIYIPRTSHLALPSQV